MEIEPNFEHVTLTGKISLPGSGLVGLSNDLGMTPEKVVVAVNRPGYGLPDQEIEYARAFAEKVKRPSIAPKAATITMAYRQVADTLERSVIPETKLRQAECDECGHRFAPHGVDDFCHQCGTVNWIYKFD